MTRVEHLLVCAAEECSEVAKEISKCLRFQHDEIYPLDGRSNAMRVAHELVDLLAIMDLLHEENVLPEFTEDEFNRMIEAKQAKFEKMLLYSESMGKLDRA